MITDAEFSIIHGLWTPLSWIYLSLSIYQKAQISNDAFHQKPLETSQGLLTQTICFMFSWITQPWMRRMALLIAFVNFFVHTVKRASSCISLHCFLTRGDIKTHILYIWHSISTYGLVSCGTFCPTCAGKVIFFTKNYFHLVKFCFLYQVRKLGWIRIQFFCQVDLPFGLVYTTFTTGLLQICG